MLTVVGATTIGWLAGALKAINLGTILYTVGRTVQYGGYATLAVKIPYGPDHSTWRLYAAPPNG